jgi:pyruvate dehydrogenase E2 component (dihydrolipoamide acetyltransferase)
MATKVHMEALSPTMEEGQIVQWLKAEGDAVSNGDVLAEVETDKATMELVARGTGILRKILIPAGGTAPIGEVIGVIAAADEDIAALVGGAGAAPAAAAPPAPAPETVPETAPAGADATAAAGAGSVPSDASGAGASPETGRVKASPVARRLASEEGVALHGIQGSGPGGRIVKRDVEGAIGSAAHGGAGAVAGAAAPAAAAIPAHEGAESQVIPLTQMRKTIARRLVESIGPVPHFFLTIDVDMTRAVEARTRINRDLERAGVRVSYNDIVLKSVAMALARHPECNAHWGGDHIRTFNRVHLGVAVAVDDGLITPVIRDAERKGMAAISREVRELSGRAKEKRLKPEEYTGATFSVSNLGMFGIESFTAVINPPEAGILAVGALEERAVVVDGEVRVQPRMRMTMSCDHRVIDGAQGARFLETLKRILEEPLSALV